MKTAESQIYHKYVYIGRWGANPLQKINNKILLYEAIIKLIWIYGVYKTADVPNPLTYKSLIASNPNYQERNKHSTLT